MRERGKKKFKYILSESSDSKLMKKTNKQKFNSSISFHFASQVYSTTSYSECKRTLLAQWNNYSFFHSELYRFIIVLMTVNLIFKL